MSKPHPMRDVPDAKDILTLRLKHLDHLGPFAWAEKAQEIIDDLRVHGYLIERAARAVGEDGRK